MTDYFTPMMRALVVAALLLAIATVTLVTIIQARAAGVAPRYPATTIIS